MVGSSKVSGKTATKGKASPPAPAAKAPPAAVKAKGARKKDAPKAAKPVAAPAPIPAEDVKLVRDSFTMPGEDFALIAQLKARALGFRRPTKKSELLRAGLQQLAALDAVALRAALSSLRPLPTGRPKKKR